MTVAFVEGPVKSLTPQELAIGCDLRPQCGGFVQDPEQYLWIWTIIRADGTRVYSLTGRALPVSQGAPLTYGGIQ